MPCSPSTAPLFTAQQRQHWIKVLSKIPLRDLQQHYQRLSGQVSYTLDQPVQTGLLDVLGRVTHDYRFNLTQATLTRAIIHLHEGPQGVSYLLGRHKRRAELAAVFDALLQCPQWHAELHSRLIEPMAQRQHAARMRQQRATQASRADFTSSRHDR